MILERIYDADLAQASYLIGCQVSGEAIVFDPRRDTQEYLHTANLHGLDIVAVTETHIHADFLSGTRELAHQTGAKIYVSDEGGEDWRYGEAFQHAVRIKHGDTIELGNITIQAVHTPGHTPEHLSFLITDGAVSQEPGFFLTGDFVFVGDLGRPDLLDEAAGYTDSRFSGATDLFHSLQQHFLSLPDYVQVLPGHGSGSACGKSLGAIAMTTVGYERNFSWWGHYLQENDKEGFVNALLNGQPDAHAYFARMKKENKQGPALLPAKSALQEYSVEQLKTALRNDDIVFIDTRPHDQVHQGTPRDALNIPGQDKAASYISWVVDPETERRPLVILAENLDEAEQYANHFVRVGIDTMQGFIPSLDGMTLIKPETIQVIELEEFDRALLLDVRSRSEHETGHVPGSKHLSAGKLMWHLQELPPTQAGPIVSYCQSGVRNSIAASALRRKGYRVVELVGSYEAWSETS